MKYVLGFFRAVWTGINVFRRIVLNLLFLIILFAIIGAIGNQPQRPTVVPDGAALLVKLEGELVEVPTPPDINAALTGGPAPQTELRPLMKTIEDAAEDEYVKAMVLDLTEFAGGGLIKLQALGKSLTKFRESGKPVFAYGDSFSQGQYYLAAHATEIMLNPLGGVDMPGFSSLQPYMAEALEKLRIDVHVFRVGEFKAAVEPVLLNAMSDEARANISAVLEDGWQEYRDDVFALRELDPQGMDVFLNQPDVLMQQYSGDWAMAALENGLVDTLIDRPGARAHLEEVLGVDDDTETWPRISVEDYRFIRDNPLASLGDEGDGGDKVGIIMASGEIVDGQGSASNIGGDALASLIRQANENEDIKALVLRVDSPGGSAFASEVIRSELINFKATGRPLVVSMGSQAASGGYLISAPADEIWASPATITGSIGVFGLFISANRTIENLGVHLDGVSTVENTMPVSYLQPMPDPIRTAIQYSVEHVYEIFLGAVMEGRDMTRDAVDSAGRGQVWSGRRAQELGLVDQLGDLEAAVASAAGRAGLSEWNEQVITRELTPFERFLQDLTRGIQGSSAVRQVMSGLLPDTGSGVMKLLQQNQRAVDAVDGLLDMNDPDNIYMQCLTCNFELR